MPESREMVINTGPVITLIAALGNLDVLKRLYSRVIVPFEVCREIEIDNSTRFGAMEFSSTSWLEKRKAPTPLARFLRNTLDPEILGEILGSDSPFLHFIYPFIVFSQIVPLLDLVSRIINDFLFYTHIFPNPFHSEKEKSILYGRAINRKFSTMSFPFN
jgi:hypothetical protein